MAVASRRQREKHERRDQILDAAEEVFFERGFNATTMDHIAAAVGLSKGALYLYFKSKEELYLGIVTRHQAKLVSELESDTKRGLCGLDLFRTIAETYIRFARQHPHHTRLMVSYLASEQMLPSDTPNYQRHRELAGRELDIVLESLRLGKNDGSVRQDVNESDVATHLWGGLIGLMLIELNQERMLADLEHPLSPSFPAFLNLVTRDIAAEAAQ